MTLMKHDLESTINGKRRPNFKSEGERKIAYFLENNSIKYHYEPGILVNSDYDKPRIWYPDFSLPEFKTYIEYYGLAGNENYNKGIKTKESVYSKMGLDVIPVYPWMLNENWEGYIMKEIKRTTTRQHRNLMAKPYWSTNKPASNRYSARNCYHRQRNNRY